MAQFLDHKDDDKTFMLYDTNPALSGTPGFEHKVRINLSSLKYGKEMDGSDDLDVLQVECPCGCGRVASVSLTGDENAQRLHAKHHAWKSSKQYVETAVAETMDRVKQRGGEPRLDPKIG